ncbi:SDR family oxidoreductase [Rhizobium sp. G187]|uniref:SDR family oxidoreductase n=1 Tax=Rhizobium sp. G187 TaxID=3451352 RepID=UPI003EE80553
MRIFLTGATGFIGSALIPELLGAGHQVLGLSRSAQGAAKLQALGAEAHEGRLEDPDSLTAGAAKADAVIHLAFDHDFSNYLANCRKDAAAIAALGRGIAGSTCPMLITSGIGMGSPAPGEIAVETVLDLNHPTPRIASELAARDLAEAGLNIATVRLSQIHDTHRQGLVSYLIDIARATGSAAFVGDGATCWSACHLSDAVRLFRMAIETAEPGQRYHAVGEEAVSLRDIANAIARSLDIPALSIPAEEAKLHFGAMAGFAGLDMRASSMLTQQRLGWAPTGPNLLASLDGMGTR